MSPRDVGPQAAPEAAELTEDEAAALVAASVRQLFGTVPEKRARDLARLVLRELRARGICLVRRTPEPP